MAHEGNKHWLRKWLHLQPHLIIGEGERPYLRRWYIIPRNRVLNIYLHHFLRSDDDRALHDHPWWFASLILKGGYWEHRQGKLSTKSWRSVGSVALRRPNALHRVELDSDLECVGVDRWPSGEPKSYWCDDVEKPAWTLIFTGPRVRQWGFLCPGGWVQWEQFDYQNGCGETT